MFYRIAKFIFLFALVGFSTITFQNITLQTSINNLKNDSDIDSDITFDMEIFEALIYLLVILGFAMLILVLVVSQTHQKVIANSYKSSNNSMNYSIS